MTAVHPFFVNANSDASKRDNLHWHQAINGPFADENWKEAEKEINTMEGMGAWDVIEHEYMNDINGN